MKILIIISEYKPYVHPRAHRWSAIAEHWAAQGHEVHIATSTTSKQADYMLDNGVHIHRAGVGSLKELINQWLPKRTNKGIVDNGIPKSTVFSRIISFVNNKIWRKIMWPDSAAPWFKSAQKLAENLVETKQPDLMISVALPYTNARVGADIKSKYPDLTWIADFGDPFALNAKNDLNNAFFYENKNKKSELNLLQSVDYLTVTTEATQDAYLRFAPFLSKKCFVIPPLFQQENLRNASLQIDLDTNKKHIAYFGSFYREERSPLDFLNVWQQFLIQYPSEAEGFDLHFFGDINPGLYQKIIHVPRVTCHGLLNRKDVALAMQKVDFLLNIGNKGTIQLPSKCVDYWAAAKPILQYKYAKHDLFDAFFEHYPNYLSLDHGFNVEYKTSELHRFFNQKQVILDKNTIQDKLKMYHVENIAAQYLELISISH